MTDIAYGSLFLAFGVSLYAVGLWLLAARRTLPRGQQSARNAILAVTGLVSLAALLLLALLITHDFSVRYVYAHVSAEQPLAYTIAAFWAGQEGSLLFWLWLVTLLAAGVALRPATWGAARWPYLLAVLAALEAFLLGLLLWQSNPFATLASLQAAGFGMNPLLQNFWMIVHPPVVFAGYALYSVPFALLLAGLLSGRMDDLFWAQLRRWNLYGWLFLGAGILLGAWWAYLELGWGGYWGWDPVENASLLPWLTGSALLHTAIARDRRGLYKPWVLVLTALTFALCLFATFVTRSGVIQSVHAFGRSSIGYLFLGLIIALLLLVGALLYRRRGLLGSEAEVSQLLSREASLLFTNLLLLGIALVIFAGTIFPALSEALRGIAVALDASFYVRAAAPLFIALFALLGVCPLLSWGATTGGRLGRTLALPLALALIVMVALWLAGVRQLIALLTYGLCLWIAVALVQRFAADALARRRRSGSPLPASLITAFAANRRRYGAHLVHLALVLIAVGVVSSSLYQQQSRFQLQEGGSADAHGYTLTYLRALHSTSPRTTRNAALLDLSRGGRHLAYLTPERNWHHNIEQWVSEVSIRSSLLEDVYVILGEMDKNDQASIQLLINPMVVWIWIGGALLLLGTLVALAAPTRVVVETAEPVAEEAAVA